MATDASAAAIATTTVVKVPWSLSASRYLLKATKLKLTELRIN
jgi:hypothetical protein